VRTVLRLAANPPSTGLRIVADEVGSPTYAPDVAAALLHLIERPFYGIYHLVNEGVCSRYTFAQEIIQQAGYTGIDIAPIMLADYQRDSTPPPYSPLANLAGAALGLRLRPWQAALADYLATLDALPAAPESKAHTP
jgi:dTDP-4-dehydrorhamnose reductase